MLKWVWDEYLQCYCAEHNHTIRANELGVFGGGGDDTPSTTTYIQSSVPSVSSSIADYVANYPQLMALQQQYAPQEAALQVQLAQQYAQPLGEALKTAQEAMYPEETQITQALNDQIQEGMSSDVPDWMQQEYLSNLRANLGTNAGSPIAADYTSRGLLQQKQDWKQYYNNLGLSVTNKQPVYSATSPNYTNQLAGYTANGVMGYNANNTTSTQTNTQYGNSSGWSNILGSIGGSVLGGISGGWANNFFS